jgi:hypothetical protein
MPQTKKTELPKQQANLFFNFLKTGSSTRNFYLRQYLTNRLKAMDKLPPNWKVLSPFHNYEPLLEQTTKLGTELLSNRALVHPLLPKPIAEWLSHRSDLTSLDIASDTLNWTPQQLQDKLSQESDVNIVVFYATSGLYAEISESLDLIKQLDREIYSLVIVDQPKINDEFINLVQNSNYTQFIWNTGPNPMHHQTIHTLTADADLPETNCLITWKVQDESGVRLLKPEKRSLQEEELGFLEAYLYLLLNKYAQVAKFRGFWTKQILARFFFNFQFKSKTEAEETVREYYHQMLDKPIPEIFLKLASLDPDWFAEKSKRVSSEKIYNFLAKKISQSPSGSLEIPPLFTDREYLEYFFYTTEPDKWQTYFEQKGLYPHPLILCPLLEGQSNLDKANFVDEYGLKLDLSLDKN